jgi:hypothetical protein
MCVITELFLTGGYSVYSYPLFNIDLEIHLVALLFPVYNWLVGDQDLEADPLPPLLLFL